ncbi:nucleotidyltransferase-like protein [Sphingomonas sp. PP-F2F-G114-C0414]|uniref:nucleotidyltransferase domain-containing protein n=1 Tax=Sphingomonas sp. PP-F2F-G114-C0414 TaxID=2135662 RepID=UPI000EF8BCE2|nr:nucleotidyltransferase domain-containing protein [Sphingomonas sp. PP-F2F-G114-C0414]RMB39193.1 nucleotidyltransferase-like protein [Sphingomonas sp. PP-F2F-G114-C0414]
MVKQTGLQPAEALTIAEAVFHTRYEGAAFAFAAGSIVRGEGTYLSDIDLVVVFDRLEAARRESFTVEGVPVEAFVHDPETLAWFVNEDVGRGRPSILNMIAEGIVIGRDQDHAQALREHILDRLAIGPLPLSVTALNALRYEITDAVDDFRGERTVSEIIAIGAMLHPKLVELALRGRGHWNGTGKWAPRLLLKVDTDLADRFDNAFRALFTNGYPGPVIALADAELTSHGGFLFDGDRRDAPASWRVS